MDDQFIREWLDLPSHDPDLLEEHTIKNDHWDRKYVGRMLEAIDDFLIGHELISEKVATGSPMWSDLFWMLWKYHPEQFGSGEMKPSYLINLLVGDEMGEIKDFKRLKFFAENDEVAAAMKALGRRTTAAITWASVDMAPAPST